MADLRDDPTFGNDVENPRAEPAENLKTIGTAIERQRGSNRRTSGSSVAISADLI